MNLVFLARLIHIVRGNLSTVWIPSSFNAAVRPSTLRYGDKIFLSVCQSFPNAEDKTTVHALVNKTKLTDL